MSLESALFLLLYVSAIAAAWLATYAVHSTLLIGGVWVLNRASRLARPMREFTWKLAFIGSLITTTLVIASGARPWLGRYETAALVEARALGGAPASLPLARGQSTPVALERAAESGSAVQYSARVPGTTTALRYVPLLLVSLWLVYAAAVLLRVVYVTARARRSLGPRTDIAGSTREAFDAVARSMGLARRVRYTITERLASPVALGHSEIAIPRRLLEELGPDDQRGVIAHEVAHLVRRDPWWLLAAATTESLFFFQPLNRMARMQWQEHAEYLCDELVVREQGTGLPLARSLARVAEWGSGETQPLLAPALAEDPGTLLGRVKVLLAGDPPSPRPSRTSRALLIAMPALVFFGSPAFAPGPVRGWGTAAFNWAGVVPAGQTIEIQGVLGSIRAETTAGDSVIVFATRHGRATNPDVHFEVVHRSDGVTICAVYPVPASASPNVCKPGATGQLNTRANDVEIEFIVRVPSGVGLVASSATGDITTSLLHAPVTATSASGNIDIATTSYATADAKAGNVRVSMGRTDWTGALAVASNAGNIRVTLPSEANVDITASTRTGSIHSDFNPAQERSRWSRLKPHGSLGMNVNGTIGGGGRALDIHTISGNIVVKRK
jgi:beta-lactamase regulating signal transducer with metallopeptidase domain